MTPPWSPMILATSARPRPEPRALGGDEGIENVRHQIGRNARAVVAHRDFQRQAQPLARDRRAEAHAGAIAGGQRDFAARFRQRVARHCAPDSGTPGSAGRGRRARGGSDGSKVFDERDAAREARSRRPCARDRALRGCSPDARGRRACRRRTSMRSISARMRSRFGADELGQLAFARPAALLRAIAPRRECRPADS